VRLVRQPQNPKKLNYKNIQKGMGHVYMFIENGFPQISGISVKNFLFF